MLQHYAKWTKAKYKRLRSTRLHLSRKDRPIEVECSLAVAQDQE